MRIATIAALSALSFVGVLSAKEVRYDYRQKTPVRTYAAIAGGSLVRQGSLAPSESPETDERLTVGDSVVLQLFDGCDVRLTLRRALDSFGGKIAFACEAEGYEGVLNAVILQDGKGLQVDIRDYRKSRAYKIDTSVRGVTVRELRTDAGRRSDRSIAIDVAGGAAADVGETAREIAQGGEAVVVDVLVACDAAAKRWIEGRSDLATFASLAVARMNAALANTGLDRSFSFRLVGTLAVSADAGDDFDTTLECACDGVGRWAEVSRKREEVGADLVTVLIDTGSDEGTTGLGYALTSRRGIAEFADSAYNVCAVRSVDSSHTMTHEIGHNMGAGHGDRQMSDPGPQLYPYSSGYYFEARGEKYCTIMAYNWDGFGNVYTEVPYFSSPDFKYEGVSVGTAERNDNTRTLALTCRAVAAFRASKPDLPTGGGSDEPPAPDDPKEDDPPVGGTATVSWNAYSGFVKLTWSKIPWASGYGVYRNTVCRLDDAKRLTITGNLFFYDSSAVPGKAYWYFVCPRRTDGGTSDKEFEPVKGMRALDAPVPSVEFNQRTGYIAVGWPAVEGAADYAVYRSTDPTFSWSTTQRLVITGNCFYYDQPSNSNPVPGVKYYYWIGPRTPSYTYVSSTRSQVGMRALAAPQPTATTTRTKDVLVTWPSVEGAKDYAVFRSTSPAFSWDKRIAIMRGTSYYDTQAVPGQDYYYWICPRTELYTYNAPAASARGMRTR